MKNISIFLVLLFTISIALAQPQPESDTLWAKHWFPFEFKKVIFSPDDSKIYASGDNSVKIIDALNGDSIGTIDGKGSVIDFSRDGRYIYTDKLLKLDAQTHEIVNQFQDDSIKIDLAISMTISVDKYIILHYTEKILIPPFVSSNIAILDAVTLKLIKIIRGGGWFDLILAASQDGKYFGLAYSTYSNSEKKYYYHVTLWSTETWATIARLMNRVEVKVNNIAYSPDGTMLAAACSDNTAKIFDLSTYNIKQNLIHNGSAYNLSFTPDSKYLLTTGTLGIDNRYLKVWEIGKDNNIYKYNVWAVSLDISANSKNIAFCASFGVGVLNGKWNPTGLIEQKEETNPESIVYPNPVTGIAKIKYKIPVIGNLNISIYSETGVKISTLFDGISASADGEIEWNTNGNPQGIYYCKITTDTFSETIKIILER